MRRFSPVIIFFVAVAVALLALLFSVEDVWARAGGGGSYGGGGGSGGGGSGGGGGGLGILIWLVFRHPIIGIPVIAIFVLFAFLGNREANNHRMGRTIRKAHALQSHSARELALMALSNRDPHFDEEQFLGRVSRAFEKIQSAWSNQEMTSARAFISDGILQRFSLQIEMQKADGIRNQMENVVVQDGKIASIHSGKHFDTIHVMFRATAEDHDVSLETGRRISGTGSHEEFVEFWSFHRKPGAQTLREPGSIEGNCPNCAAPLDIVDKSQCSACGSTVNSGEHDWVLAEITQEQEWAVPDEQQIPGVPQLEQRDPGFSLQHIEDRVSVMFYRWRAAEFFNEMGYVSPVLLPTMAAELGKKITPDNDSWEYWGDPAVGKVEMVDVRDDPKQQFDRIQVHVRWSGTLRSKTANRATIVREQAIYNHVYVLVRQQGVQSMADRAFSSAGCSQCGAPIAVSESDSCQFCGAKLVDGRHDWVLESVQPYHASMAYRNSKEQTSLREEIAAFTGNGYPDAEMDLVILARIMHLDGHLHEKERKALYRIGEKRHLSRKHVDSVLLTASTSDVKVPIPEKPADARAYLDQMIEASLADGNISHREKNFLVQYAKRTGLASADVKIAINRERRRQYQLAKQYLKEK